MMISLYFWVVEIYSPLGLSFAPGLTMLGLVLRMKVRYENIVEKLIFYICICHVFEKVLSLFCKDVKYKLPSPIHDDRRAVV